jgi:hypothetical protein
MAAKKKKHLNRVETRDKAKQYDAQYMGTEPVWADVVFASAAERKLAKIKALNWYNYFKPELVAYRKEIRKWMKANRPNDNVTPVLTGISTTTARLMCMNLLGWELDDIEQGHINSAVDNALTSSTEAAERVEESSVPKKRQTPRPAMLASLEDWEDDQIMGKETSFSVREHFQEFQDTKTSLEKFVRPWIEARHDELTNHWDKEAFAFGVKERNRLIKLYNEMMKELNEVTEIKRTTRRKKPPTKEKLAKGFVCLPESAEYKVKSVDPKDIIGKDRAFLFNEKYRILTELVADVGGFSGRGMEITNVNMSKSRSTKLRNPLDILPKVCKSGVRAINKEWSGLTTKTTEANPRLNRNTVVLRVM